MKKSISIIFKPRPKRWGLRGETYLWDELEQVFATIPLSCLKECFIDHFKSYFQKLTNHPFDVRHEEIEPSKAADFTQRSIEQARVLLNKINTEFNLVEPIGGGKGRYYTLSLFL